jgi:hypothetical protein
MGGEVKQRIRNNSDHPRNANTELGNGKRLLEETDKGLDEHTADSKLHPETQLKSLLVQLGAGRS